MNQNFTRIIIPNFRYPSGHSGPFVGYIRSREPTAIDNEQFFSIFNEKGDYYGVVLDTRSWPKPESAIRLNDIEYKGQVKEIRVFAPKINSKNGHVLIPHDCEDKTCKAFTVLFGVAK